MREDGKQPKILGEFLTRGIPDAYKSFIEKIETARIPQNFSRYLIDTISKRKSPFLEWDGNNFGKVRSAETIRHGLSENDLTPFGKKFRDLVKGRTFIDIPCGDSNALEVPQALAEAFGTSRYIGVDKEIKSGIQVSQIDQEKIAVIHIKADVLSFLSQLQGIGKVVVYMSGFEFFQLTAEGRSEMEGDLHNPARRTFAKGQLEKDAAGEQYRNACLTEMARIMQPGDGLIIGRATHGFAPEQHGFRLDEKTMLPGHKDLADHTLYIKE